MSVKIIHGDCRDVLSAFDGTIVDAVVTDPPYELGFMGKGWDKAGVSFDQDIWRAVLQVLKPGGHLVAFGAPRNYHRLACAIEDAGFEIRDSLMWVFGSGFPKSKNLDEDWSGWGTALKPAYEPIILARKPLSESTVAANVLRWGTGAINIHATRIETEENLNGGAYASAGKRKPMAGDDRDGAALGMFQPGKTSSDSYSQPVGRWPANICHDGSDEVLALFPQTKSGIMHGGTKRAAQDKAGSVCYGVFGGNATDRDTYADSGSAARFFYQAKASARDRAGSKHPTVKPVALMRWLVRLVTPPGGTVLDPFAGTGTTGQAAIEEGFNAVLIEQNAKYLVDIERRLSLLDAL